MIKSREWLRVTTADELRRRSCRKVAVSTCLAASAPLWGRMGRILDISGRAVRLRVCDSQLAIRVEDGSETTTPLADLAALVIS
ncbi:MAG TPA: hypothetical protein VNF74_05715 [Terriglobales bacterium]|nr:hypothetical protein [Terriglobales bacterium]